MSKITRYTIDLNNIPALTDKQKAEIDALTAKPDNEIDTSDIAPLDDGFWQHAAINPFYKPTKVSITVRIDADVLAWLKSQGKGYQTRINAILRATMLETRDRNF